MVVVAMELDLSVVGDVFGIQARFFGGVGFESESSDVFLLSLILTDELLRIGALTEESSSSDLNSNVFSASNERSFEFNVVVSTFSGNSSGFVVDTFDRRLDRPLG